MSDKYYCNHCGDETEGLIIESKPPHDKQIVCSVCNRWIKYLPKEKNLDRRVKNRYKPVDLGVDHCELCLRKKEMLGKYECLIIHHKIPIEEGGLDVKENCLVVCSKCHSEIHHNITYLRDHFTKEK